MLWVTPTFTCKEVLRDSKSQKGRGSLLSLHSCYTSSSSHTKLLGWHAVCVTFLLHSADLRESRPLNELRAAPKALWRGSPSNTGSCWMCWSCAHSACRTPSLSICPITSGHFLPRGDV